MKNRIESIALFFIAFCSGCATNQPAEGWLDSFHAAKPRSLLVVPVVNQSTDVQAPTSVLATLPFPLAEKGYYVYPVNTVRTLLTYEGLYEPAEIHQQPPEQLANLFKADAVVYVKIHEWTAKYAVFSTVTEVDFEYRIVNADGAEIWAARKKLQYQPQNNNSSGHPLADLIASAVVAAIERADPNYLPLTRQAHAQVFDGGSTWLPPGPYSPNYEQYYLSLEGEERTSEHKK